MREPDPDCPVCHGTGEVFDWVPYGDTRVRLYSACECTWEEEEEDEVDSAVQACTLEADVQQACAEP